MPIYDRESEIRLWVTIFEAAQWELAEGVLIAAIIEAFEGAEVLEYLETEDIHEYVVGEAKPEEVFDEDALKEWANENDFVAIADLENSDPEGYEESVRY